MKIYEKPSLVIESLLPDTQLANNVIPLYNEEVEISGGGWWDPSEE